MVTLIIDLMIHNLSRSLSTSLGLSLTPCVQGFPKQFFFLSFDLPLSPRVYWNSKINCFFPTRMHAPSFRKQICFGTEFFSIGGTYFFTLRIYPAALRVQGLLIDSLDLFLWWGILMCTSDRKSFMYIKFTHQCYHINYWISLSKK